ncbi:MAG TPA: thioredoxin domain-containing protein [Anaerolineales bacterium]|nr:thioredoxin domain-containing protein [Anaerolineales bacterium]
MTRAAEIRERRRFQRRRQRRTWILIIIGVALIATALLILPSLTPLGEIAIPQNSPRPMGQGTTMGDASAPVLIEEWADFQCPACRRYAENVEPELVRNYVATGKVRVVFHHFPFIGEESRQAALASMCAADQGRFWEYYDILFANQTGENVGAFTDRRLEGFAEAIGLSMDDFTSCFRGNRHMSQIDQERIAGVKLGISGTPAILINGREVTPGVVPSFEQLQQAIEAELAGSQPPTP